MSSLQGTHRETELQVADDTNLVAYGQDHVAMCVEEVQPYSGSEFYSR